MFVMQCVEAPAIWCVRNTMCSSLRTVGRLPLHHGLLFLLLALARTERITEPFDIRPDVDSAGFKYKVRVAASRSSADAVAGECEKIHPLYIQSHCKRRFGGRNPHCCTCFEGDTCPIPICKRSARELHHQYLNKIKSGGGPCWNAFANVHGDARPKPDE